MIGNCFFFKKDDNTKTKKNASFIWFLPEKERGRIVPGYPGIKVGLRNETQRLSDFVVAREIRERPRKSFITDSESYFFCVFCVFRGLR